MILISRDRHNERWRQEAGVLLSETLRTEEDVQRLDATCHARQRKYLRIAGVGLLAVIGLFYAAAVAQPSQPSLATWFQFASLFVLLFTLGAFGRSNWAETEIPLTAPLSQYPVICGQLNLLAKGSADVNVYIRSVNESGRALRLFDVAVANVIARRETEGSEACAELHSR